MKRKKLKERVVKHELSERLWKVRPYTSSSFGGLKVVYTKKKRKKR